MIFIKVLLLDNWGDKAREVLEEVAEVHTRVENFAKYDGLITNLQPIDLRYYELGALKFVASCTTGLDHIDMGGCSKGIKIISLKGETDFLQDVWATAEHTWALIMSLIRKIPFAHNDVCAGNWNREAWQGTELHGKTLGIVGYGRVGRQVAEIAKAFGMRIIHFDTAAERCAYHPKDSNMYPYSLDYLLEHADIITVHVPLNNETRYMFDYKEFHAMKPTSFFINTSRGGIVSEDALLMALKEGWIRGAAIDVVQNEPEIWSGLTCYAETNNNLIITPHIAGNTAESREKTQLFIAQKIKDFIQGGG